MKKKLCLFFSLFLVFLLSSCAVEVTLEKPYSVKSGTYELKTAVITDMFTDGTTCCKRPRKRPMALFVQLFPFNRRKHAIYLYKR